MKIVAYNGSPKGKKSTTHIMLNEVLKGAMEQGAEVVNYTLSEKNINHCKGCLHCWYVNKNECIINDDMNEAISYFQDMDILILATPLYFDNVSGMLKVFLDRCIAYGSYFIEKDENNESKHLDSFKEKHGGKQAPRIVVICNGGFAEQSQFQAIEFMMDRMARNMSTEVVAKIFRGQGPLLSMGSNEQLKPIIENYKRLLRQAGRDIASKGIITDAIQIELDKELIPIDVYNSNINNR
ncbi:flavodoxin family protein [Clostridiaceae bacterium M8S5]|nr:flavodoxin family protein [Clostridiaceae bacterium M8S5]